jgi:hypothetical protein
MYHITNIIKKPRQYFLIRETYLGVLLVIRLNSWDTSVRCCSRSFFLITEKTKTGTQFLWDAFLVLKPADTIHRGEDVHKDNTFPLHTTNAADIS